MRTKNNFKTVFFPGILLFVSLLGMPAGMEAQVSSCCNVDDFAELEAHTTGISCFEETSGPNPTYYIYATGQVCTSNVPVIFSFPACDTHATISVNFGDGSGVFSSFPASHSYSTPGTYTITIQTYYSDICTKTYSIVVTAVEDCCPDLADFDISFAPVYGTGLCAGSPIACQMTYSGGANCAVDEGLASVSWSFSGGGTGSGPLVQHTFSTPGTYTVTGLVSVPNCITYTVSETVAIVDCEPAIPCTSCIGSFAPEPGEYVATVWVRELDPANPFVYASAKMELSFTGAPSFSVSIVPTTSSRIIDGWQRMEGQFTVPPGASQMIIDLKNTHADPNHKVYFDDIRIHPFNSSMKTYVYDPVTLRLVAELDERNYATLYEYDEEGILIRVKKETEKGIMTIKETRQNNSK
jgi:PKD repeat protein